MIQLIIYAVDGERTYTIESPNPIDIIKFNQKFGHEGCDYQMEVDDRNLEMDEIEKWFEKHNNMENKDWTDDKK
jgi:hypothetical protein